MTLIELHVKALKLLQDDKSFRTAKLNQCQSNIGKMQFGRLITFLSLLKVTYPHIEGWGRSEVVKTPDGKTKIRLLDYDSLNDRALLGKNLKINLKLNRATGIPEKYSF